MEILLVVLYSVMVVTAAVILLRLERRGLGDQPGIVVLMPLRGHVEDIEYRLRGLCGAAKRGIPEENALVYVVDLGMEVETREICARMSDGNPSLRLVKLDDLGAVVEKICE